MNKKRPIFTINLTPEAYKEHVEYKHMINSQISYGKYNNCESFGSKLAGHAVRLAGAVHFLQHEEPWNEPIDASAMKGGIAIAEFFAEQARSVFDHERVESLKIAKKILNKIIKKRIRPYFSLRDAHRKVGSGRYTVNQISLGLDMLESHHYIASYTDLANKTTFIVNPNIFNGFGYHSFSNPFS